MNNYNIILIFLFFDQNTDTFLFTKMYLKVKNQKNI